MTTSAKQSQERVPDKKIKILRDYQEKVVDLSRRNRLLKYPAKARRISFDLNLEDFHEHYGMTEDFAIDFPHKLVLKEDEKQLSLGVSKKVKEKEDVDEKQKFIPETNPKGEKLLNAFTSLRLDAKRKFEEHGLNTLFLTIGKVQWKEKLAGRGSSEATDEWDYNAPLLLIPIKIEEYKQPIKKTVIRQDFESGEITVNPVLLLFLEREYGIVMPDMEIPEEVENISTLTNQFINKFKKAFSESKIKHNIDLDIEIGQYSFYGQQIYEDLRDHEDEIAENPFITSLCDKDPLHQRDLSDVEPNPERLLHPEEDYSVMDADVSQLEVIQKVLWGQSMVVQGPPGTGKSQTIVNLVSNLLARGKTVLVVCEKQVALEVVLKRLRDVGLDKLCLPLFQYSGDKSRFAKGIIEDRNFIIKNFSFENKALNSSLGLRQRAIDHLKDYAKTLSKIVDPLGRNVFWVHGELSRMQSLNADEPVAWKGGDSQTITIPDYHEILGLLENISPLLIKKEENSVDRWQSVKKEHFSPDYASRVFQVLSSIKKSLKDVSDVKVGSLPIRSVSDIKKSLESAENVAGISELNLPSIGVISNPLISEFTIDLNHIHNSVEKYKSATANFKKKYLVPESLQIYEENDFRGLDGETLIMEVEKAMTNLEGTEDSFKFIKKLLTQNKADYLLSLHFNELLKFKPLFELDSVINRFNSWKDIVSLRNMSESLGVLNTIYHKLESAKSEFEKRAITFSELNETEALAIADRFQDKYKYFFRFIYPQYKKDCKTITSWCGVEQPKTFSEFNKIASNVQDCFRLTLKFKTLLQQFNQKWIAKKEKVEYATIPIAHSNLSKLMSWLTQEGKEEIPQQLFNFIEPLVGQEDLTNLALHINSVEGILDSLKIFGVLNSDSFAEIDIKRKTLEKQLKKMMESYNSGVKYIPDDKPTVLSQLQNDLINLSELSAILHPIIPKIRRMFGEEKRVTNIIEDINSIVQEKNKLSSIVEAVSKLIPNAETLTLDSLIDLAKDLHSKNEGWKNLIEAYDTSVSTLNDLFESKESLTHLESLSFIEQEKYLSAMSSDMAGLENQMNYARYAHILSDKGHAWFLKIIKGRVISNPAALFAQSLWNAWLETHYHKNPALRDFNVLEHKRIMSEFKSLEKDVLKINASRVLGQVGPLVRSNKSHGSSENERYLVRQSELQRRHKPIRQVVTKCADHLQRYKPCWMMSPLTLSSYIPFGEMEFDVVIFDEASQMRVEHALGAIARARQVVIFGDEHQLPPTSFFDVSADSEDEEDEQDFESILHASKTVLPTADESLLYHYRSKYEDLIAFCNHEVYSSRLVTFPNPSVVRGVEFEYVSNGVFDGSVSKEGHAGTRRNDIEAKRVAEVCAKYATDYPDKSIGVIAFSKSQEVAIRDAIIDLLKTNPEVREKLNEDDLSSDAFFIKNLESVQGDERDIIVLSIGYGRDRNGNIYNRFGPINSKSGYRRLNVAFTRAKEKIICVSSIKATDFKAGEASRGAKMLQRYLDYAENGPSTLVSSQLVQNSFVDADSPFELDVEKALVGRGYKIERQVGASGYKIDLAVIDPKNDGRYILGIECDGATYHSSYSARVNDRLRQDVLERLGWKIYRVWSQHWITHKDEIIDDVIKTIKQS